MNRTHGAAGEETGKEITDRNNMSEIMKRTVISICVAAAMISSCSNEKYDTRYSYSNKGPDTYVSEEDMDKITSILALSSLNQDDVYLRLCDTLQKFSDAVVHEYFNAYTKSEIPVAEEGYERYDAYFQYHVQSLRKVVDEVKTTEVQTGAVHIWLVYNMGYVIKTAENCFGIDISHKHAIEFAPYLDFLLLTHEHGDHFDQLLIDEMGRLGKPVISNFVNNDYMDSGDRELNIGEISIKTVGGYHETEDFVQIFCIDCGASSDHFTMMHIGDSQYLWRLFQDTEWPHLDLFIGPYSNARQELDILDKLVPDYTLVSHISEMRHPIGDTRWTWKQARDRAALLNESGTSQFLAPLCGEHFVWDRESGLGK